MFGCNHRWEVKSDEMLPSAFEQAHKNTERLSERKANYPYWAFTFTKTHILVMVCSYCGKIDKTITKSEAY